MSTFTFFIAGSVPIKSLLNLLYFSSLSLEDTLNLYSEWKGFATKKDEVN